MMMRKCSLFLVILAMVREEPVITRSDLNMIIGHIHLCIMVVWIMILLMHLKIICRL